MRSPHNEKPAHSKEEQPQLTATGEKLCKAAKTQQSQK